MRLLAADAYSRVAFYQDYVAYSSDICLDPTTHTKLNSPVGNLIILHDQASGADGSMTMSCVMLSCR